MNNNYKFIPCQVNFSTNWLYIKRVARGRPYWFSRFALSCIIISRPLSGPQLGLLNGNQKSVCVSNLGTRIIQNITPCLKRIIK